MNNVGPIDEISCIISHVFLFLHIFIIDSHFMTYSTSSFLFFFLFFLHDDGAKYPPKEKEENNK